VLEKQMRHFQPFENLFSAIMAIGGEKREMDGGQTGPKAES
jgi:hypothetical protein